VPPYENATANTNHKKISTKSFGILLTSGSVAHLANEYDDFLNKISTALPVYQTKTKSKLKY